MYDHLIIGQGIAGSVLALTLLKRGKNILVIDDDHTSHSSLVAAGLVNPVVPKRLTPTWKAAELIPFARIFYREAEQLLNTSFYHDREMVKPFGDENEKQFWQKQASGEMREYLSDEVTEFLPGFFYNEQGCGRIKQVANLDTAAFLKAVKDHLVSKKAFMLDEFDHGQLSISNGVSYKGISSKHITFCEGYRATANPYFHGLPFGLTKGEVLTVKIKDLDMRTVVNKGVFVLPIENELFRVGATYRWNNMNEEATDDARAELLQKLEKILKVPYEIIDQKAGVRPTVKDRRPLIGVHPEHPFVSIFNGLGSKGVMIAPYYALHFTDHLDHNIPLDPEVDIARFTQ